MKKPQQKSTIKESELRKLIRQQIKSHLNEGIFDAEAERLRKNPPKAGLPWAGGYGKDVKQSTINKDLAAKASGVSRSDKMGGVEILKKNIINTAQKWPQVSKGVDSSEAAAVNGIIGAMLTAAQSGNQAGTFQQILTFVKQKLKLQEGLNEESFSGDIKAFYDKVNGAFTQPIAITKGFSGGQTKPTLKDIVERLERVLEEYKNKV